MPPPKSPQPTPHEVAVITGWIAAKFPTGAKPHGRVVLRRLNRSEYQNTVRDLLGIEVDVKGMLPEDASAEGFDNVGAALRISAVHMQCYLEAADVALDAFFAGNGPEPKVSRARYSFRQESFVKMGQSMPRPLVTDDAVVILNSSTTCICPFELKQFRAPAPGKYRFRISAYGHNGKRVTTAIYAGRLYGGSSVAGYFDVAPGEPSHIDFTCTLKKKGDTIRPVPYRLGFGNKPDDPTAPGLALRWAEVEGPLIDAWPPAGYRRLVGNLDLKRGSLDDAARGFCAPFVPRAFRRPVRDAELHPFLDLVRAGLKEKRPDAFEVGLRTRSCSGALFPAFSFPGRKARTARRLRGCRPLVVLPVVVDAR